MTADWHSLIARSPEDFASQNNILVKVRHAVTEIDAANKKVKVQDLEGGSEFWDNYDSLVVSTGAMPVVPPLPGRDLSGVFVLRSLTDALAVKEYLGRHHPKRATIVGAGSIGLEMCESFMRLGLEVDLVEKASQVMPIFDTDISESIQTYLEQQGITCHTGQGVLGMEGKNGKVAIVETEAHRIQTDLVLLSIGVKPSTELAKAAGLELGVAGAIRVDERMRTNLPDVFAAGDCITTRHLVTGEEAWIPLGDHARKQGRVAGSNVFGGQGTFRGVQGTVIVKSLDLTIGKTGLTGSEADAAGFSSLTVTLTHDAKPQYYPGYAQMTAKVTADKTTRRLVGAQIIGPLKAGVDKRLDILSVCIRAGFTVKDVEELDLAYAPPYSHAIDMPITAANLLAGKLGGDVCACDPDQGYTEKT